jgi:hypothetical protein
MIMLGWFSQPMRYILQVAALTWAWKSIDKELFVGQFSGLRIISYYLNVRSQLKDLKEQV